MAKPTNTDEYKKRQDERIERSKEFFRDLEESVTKFEQTATSVRFGDPSFRRWLEEVQRRSADFVDDIVSDERKDIYIKSDLKIYLQNSFGDGARLDYGTGHELNFVAFLCCLEAHKIFTIDQRTNVIHSIFKHYIAVTRTIQQHFRLEPAGSHGAWGLDDYCFLPFLWGAAELRCGNSTPRIILEHEAFSQGGLFLDSCAHVRMLKAGPLQRVSPFLASLSDVRSWTKVTEGLLKMYCVECLDKFQVMQHFHFGTTLSFE